MVCAAGKGLNATCGACPKGTTSPAGTLDVPSPGCTACPDGWTNSRDGSPNCTGGHCNIWFSNWLHPYPYLCLHRKHSMANTLTAAISTRPSPSLQCPSAPPGRAATRPARRALRARRPRPGTPPLRPQAALLAPPASPRPPRARLIAQVGVPRHRTEALPAPSIAETAP